MAIAAMRKSKTRNRGREVGDDVEIRPATSGGI
jgi:hypothetical protein